MTPKQIKKMLTKRNGMYTYYDEELEVWVYFSKTESLTKCRKFLIQLFKL